MFDRKELATLVQTIQIQSQRERKGQGLALATLFAGQVLACSVLLHVSYYLVGAPGAYWAIISAILVLQPGLQQSVNASATRIAANIIGAGTGLAVGNLLGTETWQVALALIIVIYICEPLRLDFGLRTACVSAIIVMTGQGSESVLTKGIERCLSVVIGCMLALVIQIVADRIRLKLGWGKLLAPPPSSMPCAATTVMPVAPPPKPVVAPASGSQTEE
jgi:hypothetical protein